MTEKTTTTITNKIKDAYKSPDGKHSSPKPPKKHFNWPKLSNANHNGPALGMLTFLIMFIIVAIASPHNLTPATIGMFVGAEILTIILSVIFQ